MDKVNKIYQGLPSLSLLPLMNINFKVVDTLRIQIPNEGNYHEIMPNVFEGEDGTFTIFKDNVVHLPSITKVLLATGNYPELTTNQLFVPSYFEFLEDNMVVKGDILELIRVERGDNNDGE